MGSGKRLRIPLDSLDFKAAVNALESAEESLAMVVVGAKSGKGQEKAAKVSRR